MPTVTSTGLPTAASDSERQLVPSTDNFNLPAQSENLVLTCTYKSKGANPALNKALTKTIATVERRVSSVQTSFLIVEKIIDDSAFKLCESLTDQTSLLKEWKEINAVYIHV